MRRDGNNCVRRSWRWGGFGQRSVLVENMFQVLEIVKAINNVIPSRCSLPQHDTAESLRVKANIFLNQWLCLARGNIVSGVGRILRRRQTDVELRRRVGALLDNINPVTEVEVTRAISVVCSRAALAIVELNPNEVESRVLNGVAELFIRDRALRGARDVEFLARELFEARTETVDHGSVAWSSLGKTQDKQYKTNTHQAHHCVPRQSQTHRQKRSEMDGGKCPGRNYRTNQHRTRYRPD